ncbi:MAG: hypothetical protein HFH87_09685 [Lachnospiraceae bacterium]|nr:hypothetical protein [Lachnospiraceae bacterium]
MLNSFFQAICRVGVFMICAQALMHFRAQETYEKYLKMLVSIMILIQLFIPVGAFFTGGSGEETAEALRQFRREMEAGIEAAEENAAAADAILEQMTLEEVQRRMEEQERQAEEERAAEMEAQEQEVLSGGDREEGQRERQEVSPEKDREEGQQVSPEKDREEGQKVSPEKEREAGQREEGGTDGVREIKVDPVSVEVSGRK